MLHGVYLLRSLVLFFAAQVAIAAGISAGDEKRLTPALVQAHVEESLQRMEGLQLEAVVLAPEGTDDPNVVVKAAMRRDGAVRSVIFHNGREVFGLIRRGCEVTEWRTEPPRWTKYSTDAPTGSVRLRLFDHALDALITRLALEAHSESWVANPAAVTDGIEKMRSVGESKVQRTTVANRRAIDLQTKWSPPGALPGMSQVVRLSFDAETWLPLIQEARVKSAVPFIVFQESTPIAGYRYESTQIDPALAPEIFRFEAAEPFRYIAPEELISPEQRAIGQPIGLAHLQTLEGRRFDLTCERSPCRTLVVVWATWCTPCKILLRELSEALTEEDLRSLRVLAVSVDADKRRLREYLRSSPLPFPVASHPGFAGHLGLGDGIPVAIVLDSEGKVRHIMLGAGPGAGPRLLTAIRGFAP